MKRILTVTLFVICTWMANATTRTVSNSPATLAQFSTVQAAVNASVSGDTIQIHGSTVAYASFTQTNKKLVIIGPGWSPTNANNQTAVIPSMTVEGLASNGSEYHGLTFTSGITLTHQGFSNFVFMRNRFLNMTINISGGGVFYSDFVIEGNVFSDSNIAGTTASTYQNFMIQNNYIYNNGGTWIQNILFTNNFMINHNLIFGNPSGSSLMFSNVASVMMSNNIFVRRDANPSTSTFNDNITFLCATSAPWTINSNIDGGGNLASTDPQMVDQTNVNNGVNNFLGNYTIASGPANNAGSDGEDLGLLFLASGPLNWTNSRNARFPSMFALNIVNPIVGAGQNLNVNAEGRRNN